MGKLKYFYFSGHIEKKDWRIGLLVLLVMQLELLQHIQYFVSQLHDHHLPKIQEKSRTLLHSEVWYANYVKYPDMQQFTFELVIS